MRDSDIIFLSINTTGLDKSSSIYSITTINKNTLTNWFMNPCTNDISDYSKPIIPDDICDYTESSLVIPLIIKELLLYDYVITWDAHFVKKYLQLNHKRIIDLKSIFMNFLIKNEIDLKVPRLENAYKLLFKDDGNIKDYENIKMTSEIKTVMIYDIYNLIK